MGLIRQWWEQPCHYHWLSGYLSYRNVRDFTRRMMGLIVVVLGVVPVLMLPSQSGPHSLTGQIVSVVVSALCAVMATMWFTRWPTLRQAKAFTVTANLSIAAEALVLPEPLIALLGCIAFAALAGYVGFFLPGRYLVLVLVTVAVIAVTRTAEIISESGDVSLAAAAFLMIAVGVLAVPFSAQVLVHLLGDDALQSNIDPLTGLYNRRGFERAVRELTAASAVEAPRHLAVAMIDLDRFKHVNDTRGHATGDRLLVAVAASLRDCARDGAVVARVGGEEFLIAEATHRDNSDVFAERLRATVATLPWDITASVGVACGPLGGCSDTEALLGELVRCADAAMYEAKRSGGNQYRRAQRPAA